MTTWIVTIVPFEESTVRDVHDYLLLLLSLVAIVPNVVILLTILIHKELRKQHNIFIFNLALAHFINCLTTAIVLSILLNQELALEILIRIWYISAMVSSFTPLLAAVYQFLTIRIDPFGVRNIVTTRRCLATCVVCWLFWTALLFYWSYDSSILHIITACSFFAVLIITTTTNVLIYRSIASSSSSALDARRLEENKRLLRTFALIFLNYVVFWSLPCVHSILTAINKSPWSIDATAYCVIANCLSNPMVFLWRSRDFRAYICVSSNCRPRNDQRVEERSRAGTQSQA